MGLRPTQRKNVKNNYNMCTSIAEKVKMNARRQKQRPWFRIIRDLMGAGVSMAKISHICGKSCSKVVQHWADGGEPKDSDARIVLALYRQHCHEQYTKHMQEFEPEVLEFTRHLVYVKPDSAIRGRPMPRVVAVTAEFDFFVKEPV